MPTSSVFRDRHILAVGAFTLFYLLVASFTAVSYTNWEFVLYIAVVFVLGGVMLALHPRVGFTPGVFWGLSIWGLLHMIGGLVRVPASWPVEGGFPVVYNWWIIPGAIKMDNLIHAYGFAVATWVCWQVLKAGVRLARPSFGLLVLCALAGMGLGSANEIVEYIAQATMDTNVGGYENTAWDIIWNAVGCSVTAVCIGLSYALQPRATA